MGALGLFTTADSMIMMMVMKIIIVIVNIITNMVVILTRKDGRLSIGALGFIHHGSRSDTTREQLKPPNVMQSEKNKCVKLKANILSPSTNL